uniref:Uncharacterized protein n=1 Tax=Feitosa virus TaxID=2976199 RepID=A0A9E8DEY1_9VIRU|nr:hypothetical protein 3 [Feitosa virus]UZH43556.1 hypothetical protein 3 [Feitosa virus]UZH43571.1 hypothetical protein 3 [Feitosa virus]
MVLPRNGTVVRPSRLPVPIASAQKPLPKSSKPITESEKLDFSKYFDYVTSAVSNTTFVVCFFLSAYLCYNYTTQGESSYLVTFVVNLITKFVSLKSAKCDILNFVLVSVPFVPAIMTVSPKRRFGAIICTVLYYMFVPERTVYEYLIHGAIVYLILRTTNKQFQLIGYALLFLSYVMQFAIPLPSGTGYNCTTA